MGSCDTPVAYVVEVMTLTCIYHTVILHLSSDTSVAFVVVFMTLSYIAIKQYSYTGSRDTPFAYVVEFMTLTYVNLTVILHGLS